MRSQQGEPQIELNGLSKRFLLYSGAAARLRGMLTGHKSAREHVALRDVSLSIVAGESIGILGRNGAGKSTLLGLIAGTCLPTSGTVSVRGQVAALLELGAGYHSGWSGRQNAEFQVRLGNDPSVDVAKRLAEIEVFADLGDYFDQPLRTYSSGMAMRLSFAAAICAEPDILLIDETLAVGDTTFQHKCFRRIEAFRERGGTMILVTHRTDLILQLCTRALVLHDGRLDFDGDPDSAALRYYEHLFNCSEASGSSLLPRQFGEWGGRRLGIGGATISNICVNGTSASERITIAQGEAAEIIADLSFQVAVAQPIFSFTFKTVEGVVLYSSNTALLDKPMAAAVAGDSLAVRLACLLPLATGTIFLDLSIAAVDDNGMTILDAHSSVAKIDITGHNCMYGLVDLGAALSIT
ncbi:MAG: ABC transporter ATP-binding protein [Sphingopyxis sp.]